MCHAATNHIAPFKNPRAAHRMTRAVRGILWRFIKVQRVKCISRISSYIYILLLCLCACLYFIYIYIDRDGHGDYYGAKLFFVAYFAIRI